MNPYLSRLEILATFLFLSLLPAVSHGQMPGLPPLVVVGDHGGQLARPYYVAIGAAGVDEEDGHHTNIVGQPSHRSRVVLADMLPVVSDQLSPGAVTSRPLHLPVGMTPFFLIGDDAFSRQWLADNADVLRSLHAVGMVVNVTDQAGFDRLRSLAPGLELQPVPGDDIAQRLRISHYPVLVTANELSQ